MLYLVLLLEQFFAVIGASLGFNDPASAQYIGFALHIMTGMAAGNVFGQISLFWSKIAPYNSREGVAKGMVVGVALWTGYLFHSQRLQYNHDLIPLHILHPTNISTI
jgi:Na+/proline symporter